MNTSTSHLLAGIKTANRSEIDAILDALSQRFASLYPEWELSFLTLPRNNPELRRSILRRVMELEDKFAGQR